MFFSSSHTGTRLTLEHFACPWKNNKKKEGSEHTVTIWLIVRWLLLLTIWLLDDSCWLVRRFWDNVSLLKKLTFVVFFLSHTPHGRWNLSQKFGPQDLTNLSNLTTWVGLFMDGLDHASMVREIVCSSRWIQIFLEWMLAVQSPKWVYRRTPGTHK